MGVTPVPTGRGRGRGRGQRIHPNSQGMVVVGSNKQGLVLIVHYTTYCL